MAMDKETGLLEVNGARLYYERAGAGTPLIMLHAGIADSRMWEHEFASLADSYRTLRYDMRGYGRSLPAPGEFNIQDDLQGLLEALHVLAPIILMGCSMGGGLAIDFALAQPDRVAALILVGSDPAGFQSDAAWPDDLIAQSEAAFARRDIDEVAELDMQIWFDGVGRSRADVDPAIRAKAYAIARQVTAHELSGIGEHVRKPVDVPAARRLHELTMPALLVVGENDLPHLHEAADYMAQRLPQARKLVLPNAGHLPNMEHPALFESKLREFLSAV
ncbi:MAG: alpha/beta hydrolase [Chloroflexi bacterium]|nr:alpha/beta hydrolase [Chloroflexota bacterium]